LIFSQRCSVAVFQSFVAALEVRAPVLMTENIHDMLSLWNELSFTSLLSEVSGFISAPLVADYEAG
jgi:hypothetical protein